MSLRARAVELVETLRVVVRALGAYNKDSRASYTRSLSTQLEPLVSAFADAVLEERSREVATRVLPSIEGIMQEASAAATKGEIEFVSGEVLNRYWELHTIFREQRYREQEL